ncbi:hypothetical protein LY76DRAFT_646813 [Colletotrichum caudatum]|nr:hypothetical protein LY76DRAFT_646813 [Colletotrichum caudatum]
MKLVTVLSVLTLAAAVAADDSDKANKKKVCINGCIKCYCGDVKYDDHGNCDLPGGFTVDCGTNLSGICIL